MDVRTAIVGAGIGGLAAALSTVDLFMHPASTATCITHAGVLGEGFGISPVPRSKRAMWEPSPISKKKWASGFSSPVLGTRSACMQFTSGRPGRSPWKARVFAASRQGNETCYRPLILGADGMAGFPAD